MPEKENFRPYSAEKLSPLEARLLNALLTRRAPWLFNVGGNETLLHPLAEQPDFDPEAVIIIGLGRAETSGAWAAALSYLPLRLFPSLAEADASILPDALKEALVEILAEPLLHSFQEAIGRTLSLKRVIVSGKDPDIQPPGGICGIGLRFDFQQPGLKPLFIRVSVPDAVSARRLGDFIRTLPLRRGGISSAVPDRLPVPVSLEAGWMRLNMAEIHSLAVGDILFPEDYPAARKAAVLRVGHEGGACWTAPCVLSEGTATINGAFCSRPCKEDADMAEQAGTEEQGEGYGIDPDDLEMTLVFELERRVVSVRELSALAPGYTFALAAAPDSPVTLRAGGKPIGCGRLVDLNGTLGVRLTKLGG